MKEDTTGRATAVTRLKDKNKEEVGTALMSFTAVSTHKEMATAFVNELIRLGKKIMPDKDLSIEDLIAICHTALEIGEKGIVMLEGRHLRGRIGEQISRADRYDETFSIFVIRAESVRGSSKYDAIVDTLCERLRKTDLMFLSKQRVVLLLPHTIFAACKILSKRIHDLLGPSVDLDLDMDFATYPSEGFEKGSNVLDWAEDQIRG